MILNFIIFFVGLYVLIKGSDKFIFHIKLVAESFKVSEYVIGLILASIATTLPEITVSIIASLQGDSSLALGNALGSVLVNISLILGICSFFKPMKVDEKAWRNSFFLLLITTFLWFLMIDSIISRIEGFILIIIYVVFLFRVYKDNKKIEEEDKNIKFPTRSIIWVFLSGLAIVIGARLLVTSAINIARSFGISEAIIGLTLVAFGTSLPEFANSITSVVKKLPNIGTGNVIGANIINILIVVGLSSLINPIKVEKNIVQFILPLTLLVIFILTISLKRDNIIGRKTGFVLLLFYILFIIGSFSL
ncbi:MAG: cation transporter [Dictyoglomus sp. NZ13-RE01]|nr:MAG: cation transporter [Dictyoglomus sp. NZ13-RE01]